jgi:hypothetical protein
LPKKWLWAILSDSPLAAIWRYNGNEKEKEEEGRVYLYPITRFLRIDKANVLALMEKHGMKWEEEV